MIKLVRGQAPFILVALIVLSPVLLATVQEHEGQKIVEFPKILAHPEAFQGIEVAFVVQFHELNDSDNPVFTRFLGDWYLNFAAWEDGAELWTRAGYLNDHPYLFAKRGGSAAGAALKARIYSRWLATGIVRRIFKGKPWIEVTSLSQLGTQIDKPSLAALAKGFKLANEGQHVQAALAFRAAEHNGLPANVRTVAIHQEAISLHDAGRIEESIRRLETGKGIMPEDAGLNWSLQTYRNELAAMRSGEQPGLETTPPAGEEVVATDTTEPGQPEEQPETAQPTETTEPEVVEPMEVVKSDPPTGHEIETAPTQPEVTETTDPAERWPDLPEPTLTQPAPKPVEVVEPEPETQVVEPQELKVVEPEQVQPETTEPEAEKPEKVWHDLPEPTLTYPKPKPIETTYDEPLPPIEPEMIESTESTESTEPPAAKVEPETTEPEMIESTEPEPEAAEPVTAVEPTPAPVANPVPVAIVHPDTHPVVKAEPTVAEPVAAGPEVMEEPVLTEQPKKKAPVQKASLEIVPAILGQEETTRTHEALPRTKGTHSN